MAEQDVDWRLIRLSRENLQGKQYRDNNIVTSRYTIFTFLPKVLYELFRKKSNFFFLCLIILQLSLDVPTNPSAYIIAFAVVIVVSLVKQAYEDWVRHRADDKVNFRIVHGFDSLGNLVPNKARNIRVGEIIRLSQDEPVPCDLLLLCCLSPSGEPLPKCEITTANLDGEPNRKLRFCPSGLPDFNDSNILEELTKDNFVIEYDQPNADLYHLSGILTTYKSEKPVPISMENVLLRGTTVKSAGVIYGVTIYTGQDTRLSLNSIALKQNKFSTVDHATNVLVYIMFVLLLILCGIALGLFFWMRDSDKFTEAWYIPEEEDSQTWLGVTTFFLFLVFLSYLIPISLSVSVEIQKFGCSKFFGWDNDMRCSKTGNRALCNTSDLNDELGQIEYLLTDKTGTLTENNLKFTTCSINGIEFEFDPGQNVLNAVLENSENSNFNGNNNGLKNEKQTEFFQALALCHTAHANRIEAEDGVEEILHYQSSSADEEVLVAAANSLGVKFLGEDKGQMTLETQKQRLVFRRHLTLEFESDRKCMSVIVEDAHGKFIFITKGAESSLLPKCKAHSDPELLNICSEHVNKFAKAITITGLRTLVVAKKQISSEEMTSIQDKIESLRRKPNELQAFYSELERDLRILGVTGVEDQLQDFVPETLGALKEAGIRIWMLTGDKMETAVNVGISCGLAKPSGMRNSDGTTTYTATVSVPGSSSTDVAMIGKQLEDIKKSFSPSTETTLVIDGISFAVGFENCLDLLSEVAMKSSQVIFCRMAPLQKAQVVRLIKASKMGKNSKTCAIGDGGNDVAMIQEAHIGIGIIGREGRQASRSADFAVPGFQYLRKAILVHGYWYYYRVTNLVSYFFYRGLLFVLPQFLYGFDSGFSGQTVYHSSYMMCYALIFSALPIVIYGLSEQPKSVEELLANPRHYKEFRGNALMGWKACAWWGGLLIWHLAIVFYLPRLVWEQESALMDWGFFSHFLSGAVVAVTDMKIASDTIYFTWVTAFGQAFSYLSMLLFYSISSEILKSQAGGFLKFAYFPMISKIEFWLVTLLVTTLASLPDLVVGGFRRLHFLQQRSRLKAESAMNS